MATLNIGKDQGAASKIAVNEVLKKWDYKDNTQYTGRLNKILNNLPHGTYGDQLEALYKMGAAANSKGDEEGYRAIRAAMVVITRTEQIQQAQERGIASIDAMSNAMFNQMYVRGKALANGAAESALEQRSGYHSKNGLSANEAKLAKAMESDKEFKSGEYLSAGIKPAKVADGYIRANAAEIGGNAKNIAQAFNIVNTVVKTEGITNFDKALARVHELRDARVLEFKGAERESIKLSYDLAATHLQLQKEVAAYNKKGGGNLQQLAGIGMLRQRAIGNAARAYDTHGESLRAGRVTNLSPFEAALQLELTASERPAVEKMYTDIRKLAKDLGVTSENWNQFFKDQMQKRDSGFMESDADRARQVWDRAQQIARDADALDQSIFTKPKAATAKDEVAAEGAIAPTAKANHYELALDQVLKDADPKVRAKVISVIESAEGPTTPQKMAYLSEALKEPGAEDTAIAPYIPLALGVLHLKQRMDKDPATTKFSDAGKEAHLDAAMAMADEFAAKRTDGQDIAKEGVASSGHVLSGKRGRFTSEELKAIIERNAGRYAEIDPELQAKLEAKGFSTGQRAGVDVTDLSQLDGILGEKTKASIEKVLGREITIPMSDEDAKELNEKLDAMEESVAKEGEEKPAVAQKKELDNAKEKPVSSASALKAEVSNAVAAVSSKSSTAIDYREDTKAKIALSTGVITVEELPQKIKEGAIETLAKLKENGLSDKAFGQISNSITIVDGKVYSPLLKALEVAIGMKADGFMDERMATFLGEEGDAAAKKAVALAFNSGSITLSEASGSQIAAGPAVQGKGKSV